MESNLKDKLLKETEKISSSELLMVLEWVLIELTKEGIND